MWKHFENVHEKAVKTLIAIESEWKKKQQHTTMFLNW